MSNPIVILIVVLLVLGVVGGGPWWGYHQYGYTPSISIGGVLIVVLILYLLGVFK